MVNLRFLNNYVALVYFTSFRSLESIEMRSVLLSFLFQVSSINRVLRNLSNESQRKLSSAAAAAAVAAAAVAAQAAQVQRNANAQVGFGLSPNTQHQVATNLIHMKYNFPGFPRPSASPALHFGSYTNSSGRIFSPNNSISSLCHPQARQVLSQPHQNSAYQQQQQASQRHHNSLPPTNAERHSTGFGMGSFPYRPAMSTDSRLVRTSGGHSNWSSDIGQFNMSMDYLPPVPAIHTSSEPTSIEQNSLRSVDRTDDAHGTTQPNNGEMNAPGRSPYDKFSDLLMSGHASAQASWAQASWAQAWYSAAAASAAGQQQPQTAAPKCDQLVADFHIPSHFPYWNPYRLNPGWKGSTSASDIALPYKDMRQMDDLTALSKLGLMNSNRTVIDTEMTRFGGTATDTCCRTDYEQSPHNTTENSMQTHSPIGPNEIANHKSSDDVDFTWRTQTDHQLRPEEGNRSHHISNTIEHTEVDSHRDHQQYNSVRKIALTDQTTPNQSFTNDLGSSNENRLSINSDHQNSTDLGSYNQGGLKEAKPLYANEIGTTALQELTSQIPIAVMHGEKNKRDTTEVNPNYAENASRTEPASSSATGNCKFRWRKIRLVLPYLTVAMCGTAVCLCTRESFSVMVFSSFGRVVPGQYMLASLLELDSMNLIRHRF